MLICKAIFETSTTSLAESAKIPVPSGVVGSSKTKGFPKAGPFAKSMETPTTGKPGITNPKL
jgi:hypothetical protein